MKRDEKAAKVEALTELMKTSTTMLVADYRGLTVAESRELRTGLREAGCTSFEVVKNTLTRRAADEAGVAEIKEYLTGPSAIAFCEEESVEAAKVLVKYAKDFKPLEIKGGMLSGQAIDADRIKYLASLPTRDVLVAQVLGTLQAPIRGLVTVLAGNMRGLVTVLDKIREQKEAAA